jgi:hypothetical protein
MTQRYITVTAWLADGRPPGTIAPYPECPRRIAHLLAERWPDRTFKYSVDHDKRKVIEVSEKQ